MTLTISVSLVAIHYVHILERVREEIIYLCSVADAGTAGGVIATIRTCDVRHDAMTP